MTVANTSLRVSELNFAEIKDNLKDFLRNKSEFQDYDFESSVMSMMLDVLAYNTYYNSVYLNMTTNEQFLDSAIKRENVVSRAKEFGYLPRSRKAAKTTLNVTFLPNDTPSEILIPAYSRFTSKVDNDIYEFLTTQDYVITPASSVYSKIVEVFEGRRLTFTYQVSDVRQKFRIPNDSLDSSLIKVYVKDSASSTNRVEYSAAVDILNLGRTSPVYFIEENYNGEFQIQFGDGILSKAVLPGAVVEISGIFCNGELGNSINTFKAVGSIGVNVNNTAIKYAPSSVIATVVTYGGQEKETREEIQFNAPKFFETQNRLVTKDDYRNYLLKEYTDIQTVSVWGGEDNVPPQFGRIVISAKPKIGFVLTEKRKTEIAKDIAKKNVLSIDPIFIDPVFTFINPTLTVYYDNTLSSLTVDNIFNKISANIQSYENKYISTFGKGFYPSKFLTEVDKSDVSITNTDATILFEKRLVPIYNTSLSYKVTFNGRINHPYDGYLGTLTSTGFRLNNEEGVLYLDDDGRGKVRYYKLNGSVKVYLNSNAGEIDYVNGTVTLLAFDFASVEGNISELKIFIQPNEKSYLPLKNEILLISTPVVNMIEVNVNSVLKSGTVKTLGSNTPILTNSVLNTVLF